MNNSIKKPRIVIIGGGFGGLRAAQELGGKEVQVTLIDRKNHFIFQPLLYQVATAVLSPGEISVPIRRVLHRHKNVEVVLGEAIGFDKEKGFVRLEDGSEIGFDYLIVAAGARHSYFGHDEWESTAPGLKTIEDAVEIRSRILLAFELAEREAILTGTAQPPVFAIVGGGPTGVELAGAIAGIAKQALAKDFKAIDTKKARVLLLEGSSKVLGTFADNLSESAKKQLGDLGVEVFPDSFVEEVEPDRIKVTNRWIKCNVVLWATGVEASSLGRALGMKIDKAGRIFAKPDLSLPNYKNIFVIGDMAYLKDANGTVVPGVSPAAIQEGEFAAKSILRDLSGEERQTFRYVDYGTMATIGRNKAIAQFGTWHYSGFIAWLMWLFVHIVLLINFRNRLAVLSEWMWAYFTRERSARLITGDSNALFSRKTSTDNTFKSNRLPPPKSEEFVINNQNKIKCL